MEREHDTLKLKDVEQSSKFQAVVKALEQRLDGIERERDMLKSNEMDQSLKFQAAVQAFEQRLDGVERRERNALGNTFDESSSFRRVIETLQQRLDGMEQERERKDGMEPAPESALVPEAQHEAGDEVVDVQHEEEEEEGDGTSKSIKHWFVIEHGVSAVWYTNKLAPLIEQLGKGFWGTTTAIQ